MAELAMVASAPGEQNRSGFDRLLYIVSDCLAEASIAREQGQEQRARALYQVAERLAFRGGFTELLQLVWTYADNENRVTFLTLVST